MVADVPTRWYIERTTHPEYMGLLHVDLVEDAPARGYRMFVLSRVHARQELPHLRRLAQSIGPREPAVLYDPVEVDGPA